MSEKKLAPAKLPPGEPIQTSLNNVVAKIPHVYSVCIADKDGLVLALSSRTDVPSYALPVLSTASAPGVDVSKSPLTSIIYDPSSSANNNPTSSPSPAASSPTSPSTTAIQLLNCISPAIDTSIASFIACIEQASKLHLGGNNSIITTHTAHVTFQRLFSPLVISITAGLAVNHGLVSRVLSDLETKLDWLRTRVVEETRDAEIEGVDH